VDEDYDTRTALIFLVSSTKGCSLKIGSLAEVLKENSTATDANIVLFAHEFSENSSMGFAVFRSCFPSAHVIIVLPEFDSALVKEYTATGARDFLYRKNFHLGSLRRSLARAFQQTLDPPPSFIDLKQITGHFQSGETILHYRILEEMDQTGWNEICRAEDLNSGRTVVLKLLNPAFRKTNHKAVQKLREAAAVRHNGLAAVGSIETLNGIKLIAEENIEGKDLRSVLQQETLGLGRTLDLGLQIAEILIALHAAGVQHGNLKPTNILLSPYGSVKLTDPGTAREIPQVWKRDHAAAVSALQKSGVFTDTVCHMAPEQLEGKQPDVRSDLFSLGSVLYHAATGVAPFAAPDAVSLIRNIRTKEPLPPSEIQPHLPESLERLLRIAMAKDPERRFESAEAMAEKLRALHTSFLDRSENRLAGGAPEEKLSLNLEILEESITTKHEDRRKKRLLAASLCAVLILIGLIVAAKSYQKVQEEKPLPSLAAVPSFTEASSPETIDLAVAATEAVIGRFSRLHEITVIQPESALRYAEKIAAPEDASKLANTDSVLTIEIKSKTEDTFPILVELYRRNQGDPVWTSEYHAKISELPRILNQIVQETALQIGIKKDLHDDLEKNFAHPSEANQSYLMARASYFKDTVDDLQKSLAFYKRAEMADPKNARIQAGMAESWLRPAMRGEDRSAAYSRARTAAQNALELDPDLAEAHAVLGSVDLLWDWELSSSEKHLRKAIKERPNHSLAHLHLARLLTATGKPQQAYDEVRVTVLLDPLSTFINEQAAQLLIYLGRYDEAIRQTEKCIQLGSGSVDIQRIVGDAYLGKGMYDEALLAYRHIEQMNSPEAPAKLAMVMAASGKKREAFALLNAERFADGQPPPESLAAAYARLGDKDRAFHWLEKAIESRSSSLILLDHDPQFENLKSDPRFSRLLKRIGLSS